MAEQGTSGLEIDTSPVLPVSLALGEDLFLPEPQCSGQWRHRPFFVKDERMKCQLLRGLAHTQGSAGGRCGFET